MDTFVRWLDKEPQEFAYMIERREVYADAGEDKNPRFLRWKPWEKKLSKLIITELKLWGCSSIVCAVAENQKIMELRLEAAGKKSILNNIYVGQIEKIAQNIQAAFVRFGDGLTGYLPLVPPEQVIFTAGRKGNAPLRAGE